jgi:ribosomal protein S18 acetylase RimI-like enzyme
VTSIRAAEAADIPALARLFDSYRCFYGQSSDLSLAESFLGQRVARSESVILVAFLDEPEQPEGFAQLYPSFSSVRCCRTFILNDLFVAPAARGRGIARRLLEAAADHARAQGAEMMTLSTAVSNLSAQRLYESAGWSRDSKFLTYQLLLGPGETAGVDEDGKDQI